MRPSPATTRRVRTRIAMGNFQGYGLEGASAVDLVVALYDGIIRFLHAAADAVERGDTEGRRAAAKRALDIILHLQSRLRMDVGGAPAQALSEFYAAIFAQILQASQAASPQKFQHAIECVRNVRDAWRQVAAGPAPPPQHLSQAGDTPSVGSRWNA
ncbi:flagellar protein FliS [Acidobacteria bacterium AB60]|nr:flagellar protein FliS [Acidobacteria bacterium AB60]